MRWEYLVADLTAKDSETWQLMHIESLERRSKVKETVGSLVAYCTKMGEEGWELVGVADNGTSAMRQLFFKRLRNE